MTDIVQMSKDGKKFYPQTHVQAVIGLPDAVGTNLYTDTRDFDNPSVWPGLSNWNKTGEKFNGLSVIEGNFNWNGLGQTVQAKKGETYTFSVYARYRSGTGQSMMFFNVNGSDTGTPVSLNENWQRVTYTMTLTNDSLIRAHIDRTGNNTNTLLIAGPKLEKGPTATDYSLNPADIATNDGVQTAIASALGKVATINVISQADYDKLTDKTGVYFIKGDD